MPARRIDKSGWRAYCDRLSKELVGSLWETATASLVVNHEASRSGYRCSGSPTSLKRKFSKSLSEISITGFGDRRSYMPTRASGMRGLRSLTPTAFVIR